MERYRNIVKIEKVKDLLEKGKQKEALSLAREIKQEKLKNIMDVCALGECFFVNGCYEEAKRCYRQAYDMNPTRKVLVAMINLAIRTKNAEEAKFYIEKFETTAPGDYNKYVYRYNLMRMEKRPAAELIAVLKELCEFEYIDKWAYELVKLYHKAGMKKECLEECENITLWFGYGEYVEKTNALIAYYKGELNPKELVGSRKEEDTNVPYEDSETERRSFEVGESEEDVTTEEETESSLPESGESEESAAAEEETESSLPESGESEESAAAEEETESSLPESGGLEESAAAEEETESSLPESGGSEESAAAEEETEYSLSEDSESEIGKQKDGEQEENISIAGESETTGQGGVAAEDTIHDSYESGDEAAGFDEKIEEARRRHLEEAERRAAEEKKKQQEAKERREEFKRKAEEDDKKFEETLLRIIDDEKIQEALSEIGISPINGKPDGEPETDTEAPDSVQSETEAEAPDSVQPETEAEAPDSVQSETKAEIPDSVQPETEAEAPDSVQPETEAEAPDSVQPETDTENNQINVEQMIMENSVFSDLLSLLKTPEPAYDSRLAKVLRKGGTDLEEAVGIYTDFESLGAQYVRCMEILLNPKASGMGIVVSGPDNCGKTSLVKGMGKLLSMAERVESSGVMMIEAEKLNEIDLETKLPKLEGHAVLINHAGKINADTAESMVKFQNRIEASTVLILEDERAAITALFRTHPKLNKAFSNRINMEPVSLEMLFRFAARYMVRKEYRPDTSAAIRLEQLIRKYYEEDRNGCLAKTSKLVRQTLKNADNRCAKVLLEYSTDGKLAQLDMSVIKGEDVSETEV